uniref:NADH-ubiquinone oxidoreductase chain 2 n=1 Tax=Parribacus antarcticus TaxID=196017 RepID=A0A515L347_PARAT|nr:NADH dehydrogenase subunit 2 [Parribacus antarcticus]QDM38497.1 NADH dehydrogenase subunit 2 [Parribacus antarcticus]
MHASSQNFLFLSLLMTGIITSISAPSWFMAWLGLELNLMSFIPLITSKLNRFPSEAALKYFLVQALGSALIIISAPILPNIKSFSLLILMALLLKLGAAPFHFWFPPIMEGLNWFQCIILMTIQKIAPMLLISNMTSETKAQNLILISALLSAVLGAVGGLNQTSLRKILAFSSINHLSWMLVALVMSNHSWIMYFTFYTMISTSISLYFNSHQFYFFSHLFSKSSSLSSYIITALAFLSLGGLPPFSGFIPKWIIIEMMTYNNMYFSLFILIMSALITLYYYLRLSTVLLLLSTNKRKLLTTSTFLTPITTTAFILSLNLFLLLTPSLFTFL